MENKRKIDAYIEPIKVYGEIFSYRMYMYYNDIDYCFLNTNKEIADFAAQFNKKLPCDNKDMMFTDKYGIKCNKDKQDSVLGYVTDVYNINSSLISIMNVCLNPDVQSDLTYHIGRKDYPLVRNANGKEYISENTGNKGYNSDVLLELSADIDGLKTTIGSKVRRI